MKLPYRRETVLAAVILISIVFSLLNPAGVKAQDVKNQWSVPTNLSNTGSTTSPALVSSPDGSLFAFWVDQYTGYQYSSGKGGVWSPPEPLKLPAVLLTGMKKAVFVNNNQGRIFIFWINASYELHFANAIIHQDLSLGIWEIGDLISPSVVDFDITADASGSLHLMFLLGEDTLDHPAGIYYMKVTQSGTVVSSDPLEQSPYFRSLLSSSTSTTVQLINPETAKMSIRTLMVGDTPNILATWNNPQSRSLMFNQSKDAGVTWEKSQEIVSPDQSSASLLPDAPTFGTVGKNIFIFWNSVQKGVACTVNYELSTDNGATWSERKSLFSDLGLCPNQNQLLAGSNDRLLLFSIFNKQVYSTAWDGKEFQDSQSQNVLSSFTAPKSFNFVQLGCQQAVWALDKIYAIGCEKSGSQDIWITSRPADDLFKPPTNAIVWSSPQVVTQGDTRFESLILIGDQRSSLVHSFWSQPDSGRAEEPGTAIYYTSWNEPQSVELSPILSSADGKSNQPSVALASDGRFYLVWTGGRSGDLMFSWASADHASTSLDWFNPLKISTSQPAAEPVIKINAKGVLYVAYLVPLNEDRGVYMIKSTDHGVSWSNPVRVFDAVAASCDMISQLSMDISNDSSAHLGWVCSTIPGGLGPYAFRYANSFDNGVTWNVLPDEGARTVLWGQVVATSKGNVHRIWEEIVNGRLGMFDELSVDNGKSWSAPVPIADLDSPFSPIGLAVDPGGKIYLLQSEQNGITIQLDNWIWDGASWTNGDSVKLGEGQVDQVESISAAIVSNTNLSVLYGFRYFNTRSAIVSHNLVYLTYPIGNPAGAPQVTPTPAIVSPTVANTPIVEEITGTQQPTPTADLSALAANPPSTPTNSITGYVIGAILTLVLITGVFLFQVFRKGRHV